MSFLITTSSHTPFDLEDEDKTLTLIEDDSNILLNYYEAMHYTDQAIGTFISGLKEKGLYQDSIIIIYGDHFGISATSEDHKMAVEEELLIEYTVEDMMNVPLIVHIPETNSHSTISRTGSQIDIYPTIINLLGLENEQGIMFGADLINSKTYNPALLQFYVPDNSFIDGNLLYLASRDRELDHSVLIDRETNEEIDASLIEHQLELNAQQLKLSTQLIEENRIRLQSLGD